MAASSSTLVRNKSLSPPVICKHEIQTTTTINDNNLEDLINLFISLIIDRNNSNELTSITTLEHLITSPQFNKCRIALKLKEKIRKCLADHQFNLEEEENLEKLQENNTNNNIILDELVTTTTTKDLQYLAKKQTTILLLNQAINQQSSSSSSKLIKQQNLSKNLTDNCIKITINVYILPNCCFNELISIHGDNLLIESKQQQNKLESFHLVERWIFIMLTNNNAKKDESECKSTYFNSKSLLTLNELFQAIKSYLHFSQISSWLNQLKGQQLLNNNIAYSVNFSNESNQQTDSVSFNQEFEFQSFPALLSNRNTNNLTRYSTTTTTNANNLTKKSCLNQFIHSNSTTINNLIRIDLYSKKRADYSLEFYLNTKNCNKYQHTSNNNNNTKKMDDITSSSSSSSNITPHLTSLILTTINTTSSIAKDEHLHHNLPQLIQSIEISNDNYNKEEEENETEITCLSKIHEHASLATPSTDSSSQQDTNDLTHDNNNNYVFNKVKFIKSPPPPPPPPPICCSLKPVNLQTTDSNSITMKMNSSSGYFNTNIRNDNLVNDDNNVEKLQQPVTTTNNNNESNDLIINSSIPIVSNNNKINKMNRSTNLPLSSSPAPLRKSGSSLFDFDNSLKNPRSIKNALSVNILNEECNSNNKEETNSVNFDSNSAYFNDLRKNRRKQLMSLNPNHLLGSFEESLLNGRMNPAGMVDGFYAVIGASGSFFPEHITLPVNAGFYQVSEDIAASPYLGIINLASLGKRGYKVPSKGTIQCTLFNPNNTVVKMFIVMYDLSDMPPNHRTFLRQRTMYVPLKNVSGESSSTGKEGESTDNVDDQTELKSFLRYLIHLRFATSKSGKIYLHTNIKLIYARDKCEIDPSLARYEYKTCTEAPQKPKYSPKK